MLPLGSVRKHIEALESRLQELEKTKRIITKEELLSPPPKQPENFFPSIGELVNNQKTGEDEDMTSTGMRTTEMGVTEIESMCMKCEETGLTRLLLTKIPFFQEVILMAFECPHCGFRDTQIKPGGTVQDKGIKLTFTLLKTEDLSRQLVKSDSCTLRIPELDFEIPPSRGVISNIEGVLTEVCESLLETQQQRALVEDEQAVEGISQFVQRLQAIVDGKSFPVTLILDDPSGNSWLDNPLAPKLDPQLRTLHYCRSRAQQEMLGLQNVVNNNYKSGSTLPSELMSKVASNFANEEVISIPSPCPQCSEMGTSDNCLVNMPFFKELLVMAFTCEFCGFRDTEIKGGGSIPLQGRREILHATEGAVDLSRDLIKSDTAGIVLVELEIELTRGSLGGMYTTVEGLLIRMKESIFGQRLFHGDSQDSTRSGRFHELEAQFDLMLAGELAFTLVLTDPLANSYIYSPFDPPSSDPRLKVEVYDRSWEEDDELGLHDMQVHQKHEQEELGVQLSDFGEMEDDAKAERVFSHLQKGMHDVHPSAYTKGTED